MINRTEEFIALGKDNLEAFTAAGKIWVAGVQDLTQQLVASGKASFEESVSTMKALSSVKSVTQALELQTAYGKTVLESVVAESNKLTEATMKLTEQALAPITARVAATVSAFSKAA